MKKYYITTVTAKGKIVGYAICDKVNGMESEHEFFRVPNPSDKAFVYMKAADKCGEMNGVKK